MHEAIPVVRVSVMGEGSTYIFRATDLGHQTHLFDGCDPGDWYRFEFGVMTQEELDALPEFGGF